MVISVRGVFLFLISIFQNCICTENDISETHRGKRNLFDSFRTRYIYNYFVFSKLFLLLIAETTFLSIYNQKVKSIRKNRLWVLTSSILKRR